MALLKCTECGNDVSSKAAACPKCGAKPPKEKRSSRWLIVLGGLVVIGIAQSMFLPKPAPAPAATPRPAVAAPPPAPLSEEDKARLERARIDRESSERKAGGPPAKTVEDCVNKGIAYFQQVGSYPRLSDGRIAVDVARERCRNTLTAFN